MYFPLYDPAISPKVDGVSLSRFPSDWLMGELVRRITGTEVFDETSFGFASETAIQLLVNRGIKDPTELDRDNHPTDLFAQPMLELSLYLAGVESPNQLG